MVGVLELGQHDETTIFHYEHAVIGVQYVFLATIVLETEMLYISMTGVISTL